MVELCRKEEQFLNTALFISEIIIYLCMPRSWQLVSSVLAFFIPDPFGIWNEAIKVGKVIYNFIDD